MSTNLNPKLFPYDVILDWYQKNGRHDLPWRQDFDPYKVWVSEIFLQQTQVSRVEKYFQKVIENFPTLHDFAKLTYEDFYPYYEWLGYYTRAKQMIKAAKMVESVYGGVFPTTYQDLISLPGIGPYTAQAILSFWYDTPLLAYDVNIEKIFSRFYYGTRFHKLTREEKQSLQQDFASRKLSAREINAALMDFSSLVDLNNVKSIDFHKYPLQESMFFKEKGTFEVKITQTKKTLERKKATLVVFLHEKHTIYYSKNYDQFEPFILQPTTKDHRKYIKEYFLKMYNLGVSVRPAFLKETISGKIFFSFYVQIQVWVSNFWEFKKNDVQNWKKQE